MKRRNVETEMTALQLPAHVVSGVLRLAHFAGARGWVPATSGNFSVRIDATACAVTASGGDKGSATAEDVIRAELTGPRHPRASAEAPLHTMLYRRFAAISAVAHVHAQSAVLASLLLNAGGQVRLEGLEMQKALQGVTTHRSVIDVPIFDNDQDMERLAAQLEVALGSDEMRWGFLLAGHGLYAWGHSVDETLRHLAAFDYLFAVSLKMKGIPV
jgi:methylthioribulose-1-phosphate dehydratase